MRINILIQVFYINILQISKTKLNEKVNLNDGRYGNTDCIINPATIAPIIKNSKKRKIILFGYDFLYILIKGRINKSP